MEIIACMLPNKSIEVTCPDVSLNCLVLVQSTTDNPEQVHVGLINFDDDRTVVLSPGVTEVSVAVYTWNDDQSGSIFTGQLSHTSLLKLPPSTSELYGALKYTLLGSIKA